MSSVHVKTFYVADKDTFEKYIAKKNEVQQEALSQFPKRITKKIGNILKFLAATGLRWSILGCLLQPMNDLPKDINVLEHCAFAISGVGSEPEFFPLFLKLLASLEIPVKWFCSKVQKRVKKLQLEEKRLKRKNKNGSTKKQASESQAEDVAV